MIAMSRAGDWQSRWADTGRRVAAAPHASTFAGAALASLALAEAITRAALTGRSMQVALALCFLALATTLPLFLLPPPAAAFAITAASVLALALFHTLTVAGGAAQLVALYRLANDAEHQRAQLTAAALAAPFLALALAVSRPPGSEAGVLTVLLAALVPAAAWAGVARRARSEALTHSAAEQDIAGALLEHTARGERVRIARELHDLVAHHISMVAVQAETARLTTPGMPAAGAKHLSTIGDTARTALTEMRRLVGVLRENADADGGDRKPQPGLAQLNDLLDQARENSGAGTRLIFRGRPAPLDPAVELAAYRITQEALTNARRHAAGAAVDVELHFTADALQLRIRDNGPGPPPEPPNGGHGLAGMRERAAVVGGRLSTGPAVGGGFLVEATLPTTGPPR